MATPAGLPRNTQGWLWFIVATVVGLAIVNSIARRVPAVGQFTQGF